MAEIWLGQCFATWQELGTGLDQTWISSCTTQHLNFEHLRKVMGLHWPWKSLRKATWTGCLMAILSAIARAMIPMSSSSSWMLRCKAAMGGSRLMMTSKLWFGVRILCFQFGWTVACSFQNNNYFMFKLLAWCLSDYIWNWLWTLYKKEKNFGVFDQNFTYSTTSSLRIAVRDLTLIGWVHGWMRTWWRGWWEWSVKRINYSPQTAL